MTIETRFACLPSCGYPMVKGCEPRQEQALVSSDGAIFKRTFETSTLPLGKQCRCASTTAFLPVLPLQGRLCPHPFHDP